MLSVIELIDRLDQEHSLSEEEWTHLFHHLFEPSNDLTYLYQKAWECQNRFYGNKVFLRALIEISNYCPNSCKYCGISRWNKTLERYRLDEKEIISSIKHAYQLGYRTFVLQGGEDPHFTDERLVKMIQNIRFAYPDAAITLSLGERSYDSYRRLREAGADRYLLRHETANQANYTSIHPGMSFEKRLKALQDLKQIGFQTGSGFLIGLPGTLDSDYVTEFELLKRLQPEMIGVGPFIPHHATPFAHEQAGSVRKSLILIALLRIAFPKALIPATTALGTLDPTSRYQALRCGANVLMPNISPRSAREKYTLYDGKRISGDESAEEMQKIISHCEEAGMEVELSRGDHPNFTQHAS